MDILITIGLWIIGYFAIALIIGGWWYCYEWYDWIVNKRQDHKFPITAKNSWQTHAFFSSLWLPLIVMSIYGRIKWWE